MSYLRLAGAGIILAVLVASHLAFASWRVQAVEDRWEARAKKEVDELHAKLERQYERGDQAVLALDAARDRIASLERQRTARAAAATTGRSCLGGDVLDALGLREQPAKDRDPGAAGGTDARPGGTPADARVAP